MAALLLMASCASNLPKDVRLSPAPNAENINPDTHLTLLFKE